ncbi:MAG: nitrite reductase small subunit NirD [Alphaproteobacteria bacterium]|nr:nitrite reductase small subunit NirD [Alphaproteobacteria bacterium]
MTKWIEVGLVSDIPVLGARVVQTVHGKIAVFRTEGDKIFALDDRCPHLGGPLSNGIVHGMRVACPLHNWSIDLDSGVAAAPDEGCTMRYPVKVEDGRIILCLEGELTQGETLAESSAAA